MTNEQREALLAGKPTKEADITKHKDWQAWQGALTEQCYYGATDNEMLKVLAPLIFAAGQADAQSELTAARARIAELETAQRWQPIESAPKDDETILGVKGKIPFAMSWASEDVCWYTFNGWYEKCFKRQFEPTHWMPLLSPPTEKE